jgi:hypothetical protein
VQGVTINLWFDGEIIETEVTNCDGVACFTGLKLGTYYVEEILLEGWINTNCAIQEVVLDTSGEHASVTFLNFELVDITVCKFEDMTGDGPSMDDEPIEGWTVYLYKNGELFDTQVTGPCGCFTWENLGPGCYEVMEEQIIPWLPMSDTEHDFGIVQSGGEYSFTFLNFEVKPCIDVKKGVTIEMEEWESHTQGYWKNHKDAWVGIDPCAYPEWVDTCMLGMISYLGTFKVSPRGDASIILAHQYLAAVLNINAYGEDGVPAVYLGAIYDAGAFLMDHKMGSNPMGEDREYALMLAEMLTDYNEGNHSGMIYPGATLTYWVNVTNCGNVPLYNVHVYDSLLDETFWLEGELGVGEWWNFTYEYTIPECIEGDRLCNIATGYGQAGPEEWDLWVTDQDCVCLDLWYYAATQGYWKNHEDAWVGISPDDMFFDSGMTWMEVFWTPPAGDMIIVLAHQYMAAMLNDEMWGVPAKYATVIEDATDFLEAHQIGDPLSDEDQQMAHDLAELLAEYNEGGVHP